MDSKKQGGTNEPANKQQRIRLIIPLKASAGRADRGGGSGGSGIRYVHTSAHAARDTKESDSVMKFDDPSAAVRSVSASAGVSHVPVGTSVVRLTPSIDRRETEVLSPAVGVMASAAPAGDSDDDTANEIVESRFGVGAAAAAAAATTERRRKRQSAIDSASKRVKREPELTHRIDSALLPPSEHEKSEVDTDEVLPVNVVIARSASAAAAAAADDDTGADAALFELPSDVQAAMQLLRIQFPLPCVAAATLTLSTDATTASPPASAAASVIRSESIVTALGRSDSASAKRMPPVILASQLYSIIADRTSVDQELDTMKRARQIRAFKLLSAGSDSYGVVFVVDLLCKLQSIRSKLAVTDDQRLLLDRFASEVWFADAYATDVHISQSQLIARLYTSTAAVPTIAGAGTGARTGSATTTSTASSAAALVNSRTASLDRIVKPSARAASPLPDSKSGGKSVAVAGSASNPYAPFRALKPHDAIRVLVQFGLLISRGNADDANEAFWFAVPDIGPLLTALTAGRRELLTLLRRAKPAKEIFVSELKKRRLRCGLSIPFVLRDALGTGSVRNLMTTIGPVIQLTPTAGST